MKVKMSQIGGQYIIVLVILIKLIDWNVAKEENDVPLLQPFDSSNSEQETSIVPVTYSGFFSRKVLRFL